MYLQKPLTLPSSNDFNLDLLHYYHIDKSVIDVRWSSLVKGHFYLDYLLLNR